MRALRLFVPAALLTAFTFTAPAFVRAQDEKKDETPHTWAIKYKKGDTFKLREKSNADISVAGMDLKLEIKQVLKNEVKDVAENGDATIIQTIESSTILFNGMEVPNPEPDAKRTTVVNKAGRIKSVKMENSQQADSPLVKLTLITETAPMSEKAVKVGDKWESEFDNPLVEGKKIKASYTLTGKEKVGDIEAIKIKSTTTIPPKADAAEKDNIEIETTYFIDPKANQVVRIKSTTKNVEFEAMGMMLKFSGDQDSVRLTEKEAKETTEKKAN
jgi:hypothetical protein